MFFDALFLVIASSIGARVYAHTLMDKMEGYDSARAEQWYRHWLLVGLVTPLVVYLLCNVGHTPILPPLVGPIHRLADPTKWLQLFFAVVGAGWFVITSYWLAFTGAWLMMEFWWQHEASRSSVIPWALLAVLLLPFAAVFIYTGGWAMAGFGTLLLLLPLGYHTFDTATTAAIVQKPSYTAAIAKMKFGKYAEAEQVVIGELERCENDFDGWMMLAELYAHHFGDFGEAERTIRQLVSQPETTASQISIALHRLADWQIKLRSDPLAARSSLEEIARRLPGTHLARMARLRAEQLPANAVELAAQRTVKKVHLPALNDDLDDPQIAEVTAEEKAAAVQQADLCVRRLQENPNLIAAREEFARLLAGPLNKIEPAIEQLRLLLDLPDQPAGSRAEWLALIAAWQLRAHPADETGAATLRQIIAEHPDSPQAFAAQRRLRVLEMQERIRQVKVKPVVRPVFKVSD